MKRMWLIGIVAGVAAGAALTSFSTLNAQGGLAAGQVVCVDVVRVFDEYDRQKDLTEEMHRLKNELEAESKRRQERIDSLQQTLDAMDPDDPAYAGKIQEMLQLQIDYKNWTDMMQLGMAREIGIWSQRMYSEMVQAVEELSQQYGYTMVLYKEAPSFQANDPESLKNEIRLRKLIWASATTDITQAVIDRLNEKYAKEPKQQMIKLTP